ncbi:hypothetical protein Tco_0652622 [Tanacetum coccineum]|uniref:Uncharacterized protein n=1 Tax=Tanacetum coccineum TaxID=301880 RepID=A0ABQ4WY20_9ASTR
MPPVITCAAALNPCFNVSRVECLIESILNDLEFFGDGFATKAKERFNDSFQGLYNIYYLKYGQPNQSLNADAGSSSRSHSGNPMTNLLNKLKQNPNKRANNNRIPSSEYERYVQSNFVYHLSIEELADFEAEILEEEALEHEAIALSDEEVALNEAASCWDLLNLANQFSHECASDGSSYGK